MKSSEKTSQKPPYTVEVFTKHLSDEENRALVEYYRLYNRSFAVMKWARRVFLLSLAMCILGFVPVLSMPKTLGTGFGLLAGSTFLQLLLISPSFEKALGELQALSDIALIRAQLQPVDLVTGKPKL